VSVGVGVGAIVGVGGGVAGVQAASSVRKIHIGMQS